MKTRQHETTAGVNATPEKVWKAVSEAEGLMRWFSPAARVTPGVGGEFWTSWGEGMDWPARITVWEPERHLRAESDGSPQVVDYYIEAAGGETVLRIAHSGFGEGAEWDGEYNSTKHGWAVFVRILKHAVEIHDGKPCIQTAISVPMTIGREEAWGRFASEEGFAISKGRFQLAGSRIGGVIDAIRPPGEFTGLVDSLDQAVLWVTLFPKAATLMMLSYGVEPERVEAAAAELRAAFERLAQ